MMFFYVFALFFISLSSYSQNILFSIVLPSSFTYKPIIKELNVIDSIEKIPNLDNSNFILTSTSNFENITEKEISDVESEDLDNELLDLYLLSEPKPENLGGDGIITIIRKDNGEQITVKYRKGNNYDENAISEISYIARCSLSGEVRKIPIRLVEIIDKISDHFGKKPIILLSGYRTKSLNDITPGAAKKSYHLIAWAMDIRLPGISSRRVKDFARRLKLGGVGYYPRYNFVHIDIGKVRYWEKYQYSKKKRKYAKKILTEKT